MNYELDKLYIRYDTFDLYRDDSLNNNNVHNNEDYMNKNDRRRVKQMANLFDADTICFGNLEEWLAYIVVIMGGPQYLDFVLEDYDTAVEEQANVSLVEPTMLSGHLLPMHILNQRNALQLWVIIKKCTKSMGVAPFTLSFPG